MVYGIQGQIVMFGSDRVSTIWNIKQTARRQTLYAPYALSNKACGKVQTLCTIAKQG